MPPKVDVDGDASAAFIPFAKRMLERFKVILPFGIRRFSVGATEVTIWWGGLRDRIRIETAGGGFLAMVQLSGSPVEAWGRNAAGDAVLVMTVPSVFTSFGHQKHARCTDFSGAYLTEDEDETRFIGIWQPAGDGSPMEAENDTDQPAAPVPWSDYVITAGSPVDIAAIRAYNARGTGAVTFETDFNDSADTALGATPAEMRYRATANAQIQLAARLATTNTECRVYTEAWDINGRPVTSVTSAGSALLEPRVDVLNGFIYWGYPIAVGVHSVFDLSFTDAGAGNERYNGLGAAFGTMGIPNNLANQEDLSGPTFPQVITTSLGSHDIVDQTAFPATPVAAAVYVTVASTEEYDYWHVYVAEQFPTVTADGFGQYAQSYPLTTVIKTFIIRSDGTLLDSTTGGWQQLSDTTWDTNATVKVPVAISAALVGGEPWVFGYTIEFTHADESNGDTTGTFRPAQWTPDMTTIHEYGDFSWEAVVGDTYPAPVAVPDYTDNPNSYLAADSSGIYIVMRGKDADVNKLFTVPLGSDAEPELLVDADEQSGTLLMPEMADPHRQRHFITPKPILT